VNTIRNTSVTTTPTRASIGVIARQLRALAGRPRRSPPGQAALPTPLLERLEERNLLTTIAWDGGGDSVNWHDPRNWAGDVLPGGTNDVLIGAGRLVHIDRFVPGVRTLRVEGTIFTSGSTLFPLAVNGEVRIAPGGFMNLGGPGVFAGSVVNESGAPGLPGGIAVGRGELRTSGAFENRGSLLFDGGTLVAGGDLTNSGTVLFAGGAGGTIAGSLTVHSGGVFTSSGPDVVVTGATTNLGMFRTTSDSVDITFKGLFTNFGIVERFGGHRSFLAGFYNAPGAEVRLGLGDTRSVGGGESRNEGRILVGVGQTSGQFFFSAGVTLDNTGGEYILTSSVSSLDLRDNVTIRGGTIRLQGSSYMNVDSGASVTLDGVRVIDETPNGTWPAINVESGWASDFTDLILTNDLDLDGTLSVGTYASLRFSDRPDGVHDVRGNATVQLFGKFGTASRLDIDGDTEVRFLQGTLLRTGVSRSNPSGNVLLGGPSSPDRDGQSALIINGTFELHHSSGTATTIAADTFSLASPITGSTPTAILLGFTASAVTTSANNLTPGQQVRVGWSVANLSSVSLPGTGPNARRWVDAVYFSADDRWDASDTLLGVREWTAGLAASASYTINDFPVTIPATATGTYRLLVRPGLLRAPTPGTTPPSISSRGQGLSAPVQVTTPALDPTGTPRSGSLTPADRFDLVALTLAPGQGALVTLTVASGARPDVFVRRNAAPSRTTFDQHLTPATTAGRLFIPAHPEGGTYYLLIDNTPRATTTAYAIAAQAGTLFISSTGAPQLPNSGNATLTIDGIGFRPGATATLTFPTGQTRTATRVSYTSDRRLAADFNLDGLPLGPFAITVTNPSASSASLNAAGRLVAPTAPRVETRVVIDGVLARNRAATIWIEFTNRSSTPIAAPLLRVSADSNAILTTNPALSGRGLTVDAYPQGTDDAVLVFARGSGVTPGTLQPGETGRVPVYYLGQLRPWGTQVPAPPQRFEVTTINADDQAPLDVNALRDAARPAWMPQTAWANAWASFQAQITRSTPATTWGDLVAAHQHVANLMARNADADAGTGLTAFLAYAVANAADLGTGGLTASSVDASVRTTGLPLDLIRTFDNSLGGRQTPGPFGPGWSHNWAIRLEQTDPQRLLLTHASTLRGFTRTGSTGPFTDATPGGSTITTEAGRFVLREPDGTVTRFRNDGQLDVVTDSSGSSVTAAYDPQGRLTALSHSRGGRLELAYNPDGILASVRNPLGQGTQDDRTTTYQYDPQGRLAAVTLSSGGTFNYQYADAGSGPRANALASFTTPGALATTIEYDALGRITRATSPAGVTATLAYPAIGELTVTDAAGVRSSITVSQTGDPAAVSAALGFSSLATYNPDGSLRTLTGPAGDTLRLTRDTLGNLASITDPSNATTAFNYDPSRRLTRVTDPRANATRYAYDTSGNLTSVTLADGSVQRMTYSPAGLLLTQTNRRGQTITSAYNPDNSLRSRDYSTTPGIDFLYTYDSAGNLTRIDSLADGATVITYRPGTDWIARIDHPDGSALAYTYDSAGRRTAMTDHTGATTAYAYDPAGRLLRVTLDAQLVAQYTYDTLGRLATRTLGNGAVVSYSHDAAARLTELVTRNPAGQVIARTSYTYDPSGRRTSATIDAKREDYTYDASARLTGVTFRNAAGTIERTVTYAYDAAGNRTLVNDSASGQTTHTANNLNQYTTINGQGLTYDADGNLTSAPSPAGTITFLYDIENRLTRVIQGASVTEYRYSALGHRSAIVRDGQTQRLLIDPAGLGTAVAAMNATQGNAVTDRWVYGLGHELAVSAGVRGYMLHDALGNTTEVLSQTAQVLNTYRYTPWGETRARTETFANDLEFGGQMGLTAETAGITFMRARFYMPGVGRFITMDPIGLAGGDTNLYAFVSNTPTNAVDPSGNLLTWVTGVAGAVFGSIVNTAAYAVGTSLAGESFSLGGFAGAALEGGINGAVMGSGYGFITGTAFGVGAAAAGTALQRFIDDPVDEPAGRAYGENISSSILGSSMVELLSNRLPGAKLLADANRGRPVSKLFRTLNAKNDAGKALQRHIAEDGVIGVGAGFAVGQAAKDAEQRAGEDARNPASALDQPNQPGQGNPNAPGSGSATAAANVVGSFDPNDKLATRGFGADNWVRADMPIDYTIRFENLSEAIRPGIAPVQRILITDRLDQNLDLATLQLTGVGFGRRAGTALAGVGILIPPGQRDFTTSIPMSVVDHFNPTRSFDIIAQITITLDESTRELRAELRALDPTTGWFPQNPGVGLMRPNIRQADVDANPALAPEQYRGEGYLSFSIKPRAGVAQGTRVTNVASIIFDDNAPLLTTDDDPTTTAIDPKPPTSHRLDTAAPASRVTAATRITNTNRFRVTWTGADAAGGSGLARYDVLVSTNAGPFRPWLSATTLTAAEFHATPGNTYAFYSIATDNTGLAELPPPTPDLTTRLAANLPPQLLAIEPLGDDRLGAALAGRPYTLTHAQLLRAATIQEPDADTVSFRIEQVITGTLRVNGAPVRPGITRITPADRLTWTPPANATSSLTQAFVLRALDRHGLSTQTATLAIQVVEAGLTPANTRTTAAPLATLPGFDAATPRAIDASTLFATITDPDTTAPWLTLASIARGATLTINSLPAVPGRSVIRPGDQLVYTPPASASGTINALTFTATDATSTSAPVALPITVNARPTLSAITRFVTTRAGAPVSLNLAQILQRANEADPNQDQLTLRLTAIDSGRLTINGLDAVPGQLINPDDALVWTPAPDAHAITRAFSVVASDGRLDSTTPVAVTASVDGLPTLTTINSLAGASATAPYSITYDALAAAANEADPANQSLGFRAVSLGAGTFTRDALPFRAGDVLYPGQTLVWTPAATAFGLTTALRLAAFDGRLASAGSVPVLVQTNARPTLTAIAPFATAAQPVQATSPITISHAQLAAAANEADRDTPAPLAFRVTSLDSGTLRLNGQPATTGAIIRPGDSITWASDPAAHGLTRALSLAAWDGAVASAPGAPLSVHVNGRPTISTASTLFGANAALPFSITYQQLASAANEADPGNQTLSFRLVSVLAGALRRNNIAIAAGATINPGDTITWTPPATASGPVQAFRIAAFDGALLSTGFATVTINTNGRPSVTQAATTLSTPRNTPLTINPSSLITALGATDPQGSAIILRVGAILSGTLRINGQLAAQGSTFRAGDSVVWTPAPTATGTVQALRLIVTDGLLEAPTQPLLSVRLV
jgi:RHS repeat-associated protein